ncbi:MAG: PhoH family protein [Granulosicoccaceae bacterium]
MTDVTASEEMAEAVRVEFSLEPVDNDQLAELCGQLNANLKLIESRLQVQVSNRGGLFALEGGPDAVEQAEKVIQELYSLAAEQALNDEIVHLHLSNASDGPAAADDLSAQISMRRMKLRARGENQGDYLRAIHANDLTFGEGPAGTGKTYLAVAAAVEMLEKDQVRRLVLVRPAVEAGERLKKKIKKLKT